jgi:predicted nicotinamide N-methyase
MSCQRSTTLWLNTQLLTMLMAMVTTALLLSSFVLTTIHCLQTRTSYLHPWKRNDLILGRTQEFRNSPGDEATTYRVDVEWNDNKNQKAEEGHAQDDYQNLVSIRLPFLKEESLASSLWPCSLAGAILCRSPLFRTFVQGKVVLEVGAGLGLTGLTVAHEAASVVLTDNDREVLKSVQELVSNDVLLQEKVRVSFLEWRDDHHHLPATAAASPELLLLPPTKTVDLVLGTDVAYYFFLLRPLMNTIQAFRKESASIAMIMGQANRESQWDLFHDIRDGCYNQLTDQHEGPLPGKAQMLLYSLQMENWIDHVVPQVVNQQPTAGTGDEIVRHGAAAETISISVLLHKQTEMSIFPTFSSYDCISTDKDESEMMMSF